MNANPPITSVQSTLCNEFEITLNKFNVASQKWIHNVWKLHWSLYGSIANGLAAQDFNKGSAELNVERGVYDWIESTVDVAEPSEGAVDLRRNVTRSAVSV